MRIAVIGRTHWLILVAKRLAQSDHVIALVATTTGQAEYRAQSDDFAKLAHDHGAPFFLAPDVNGSEFVDAVKKARADIAVSINWPTLIRGKALAAFSYGILNAHTGDLPRYRGNACANWAIIQNEPYVGLCIHGMDPEAVDAGPVYTRKKLPLTDETYIADVYLWIDRVLPAMFVEAVSKVVDPQLKPEEQDRSRIIPLRCYPRRPEDAHINWEKNADDIARLVRASSRPFAGAFAFLEGRTRVTIWRARPANLNYEICAVPGQIIGKGQRGILVACGNGRLEIEEAEMADGGTLPSTSRYRLFPTLFPLP